VRRSGLGAASRPSSISALRRIVDLGDTRASRRALLLALSGVFAVLATVATSAAAPTPGTYTGTTSERGGTVTFTVSPSGTAVTAFATSDGYNDKCHFHGGVGGIKSYTLTIPSMPLAENGTFMGKVTESNKPFSGSKTFVVAGKVTGSKASGTVTVPGDMCGQGATNPSQLMFLETFTATG
jgi:hypothetical protein